MTAALAGPYLASVGLLGLAGVAKLARPGDTAGALRAARLPSAALAVRAGALVEVGIAVAALIAPGPIPPALVAASYTAFALFVAVALAKRWPLASCGCFGRADTLPTVSHVVLNAAAALAALGWEVTGPRSVAAAFRHQPWAGVPLVFTIVVTCALAYLVFTNPLDQRALNRRTSS